MSPFQLDIMKVHRAEVGDIMVFFEKRQQPPGLPVMTIDTASGCKFQIPPEKVLILRR